ncbi:hypothetical protein GQ600_3594 [Phytophthora cactorum]|nr:hypothetical protein GQ600_3594 [Phytophthora cactorum]
MGNCVLGQTSRQCRHHRQDAHDSHDDCLTLRIQSLNENNLKSLAAMGGGRWMRIEMKRALIKHNYERPGLSQRELAAWAKVQFKLKKAPAQTTVSDILNMLLL